MFTRTLLSTAIICFAIVCHAESPCVGQATNTQRGALTGGAAGAIIGGIIGNQNDETPEGALIGGAVGAIAGGLLGNQQDRLNQQQFQHQQHQAQQQAIDFSHGVSINDVVAMTQSGVSSQLVIHQIQTNGIQQRIGVNEIIALHQQGVDNQVIGVMQTARLAGVEPPIQGVAVQTVPVQGVPVYPSRPVVVKPAVVVKSPIVVRPPVVIKPPVVINRYVPRSSPRAGHPQGRGHRYARPPQRSFHYRR